MIINESTLMTVGIPGTGKCKVCDKCGKGDALFGFIYDADKTKTVYCKDGTVFAHDYPDFKIIDLCKDCVPPGMYEKYYLPDGKLRPGNKFVNHWCLA